MTTMKRAAAVAGLLAIGLFTGYFLGAGVAARTGAVPDAFTFKSDLAECQGKLGVLLRLSGGH